jgi:hypothetical protein
MEDDRNIFQCVARGCDGCTVCQPQGPENLHFVTDETTQTYKVGEVEIRLTQLKDGRHVINVKEGCCIAFTAYSSSPIEVFDYYGWGDG